MSGAFQCFHCGRFAHFISEREEFCGYGMELEVHWRCAHCGDQTAWV